MGGVVLLLSFSCSPTESFLDEEQGKSNSSSKVEFPTLSSKKPIVRMNYDVESVSHNSYTNGQEDEFFGENNMPYVSRKKFYYEVYEDFSVGYATKKVKATIEGNDLFADKEGFSKVAMVKMFDGQINAYDDKMELLGSKVAKPSFVDEIEYRGSEMSLRDYILSRYSEAHKVGSITLGLIASEANTISNQGNGVVLARMPDRLDAGDVASLREIDSKYEVAYNEILFNEDYGVMVSETGYNFEGEVVDKLTYFYTIDSDSSTSLTSKRYSAKKYLEAESREYISTTDYFYDNVEIETLN